MSDFEFTGNNKYKNCFVCGPDNPYGLHLTNTFIDGRAHMEIVPHENMAGLDGLMHGGFSLMLMDEVMFYAIEGIGVDCVTLHSECDFKTPAYIGHKLVAEGWILKQEGRKIYTAGEIIDADTGATVVTATGLYYQMDMKQFLPE